MLAIFKFVVLITLNRLFEKISRCCVIDDNTFRVHKTGSGGASLSNKGAQDFPDNICAKHPGIKRRHNAATVRAGVIIGPAVDVEQAKTFFLQPVPPLDTLPPPFAIVEAGAEQKQLVFVGISPTGEAHIIVIRCDKASAGAYRKFAIFTDINDAVSAVNFLGDNHITG